LFFMEIKTRKFLFENDCSKKEKNVIISVFLSPTIL